MARPKGTTTREDVDKLYELYLSNKSLLEVAKTVNCSRNNIYYLFKSRGLMCRDSSASKKLAMTPARRNEISKRMLGKSPWNKGLTKETDARVLKYATTKSKFLNTICPQCKKEFIQKSHAITKFCSRACQIAWFKGKSFSPKTQFKKGNTGKLCAAYKHGNTDKLMLIRLSKDMIDWRTKCFKRDKFTCQNCGQVGHELQVHHIKTFSKYENDRFDINNGITYCKSCHKKLHKKYGNKYSGGKTL